MPTPHPPPRGAVPLESRYPLLPVRTDLDQVDVRHLAPPAAVDVVEAEDELVDAIEDTLETDAELAATAEDEGD